MINELIEKLSLDTETINAELEKSNNSKSISDVLNKILLCEELTEEELEIFKSISTSNPTLTEEEKETLEFIEFLISVSECLEDFQINLIKRLVDYYKTEDTSIIDTKYKKNKRLIESLKANELFADYDYLMEVLKQYNYSNKDILIILKGIISSNYKDFDKTHISREEEKVEIKDNKNIYDVIDIKEFKNILKKYGIKSNDIDKKYLEVLPIEDNMFKDMEEILEFITKLSLKPRALYKDSPYDFMFTLAFGTKEHIDSIEKICTEKKINIKDLIKKGMIVLSSSRSHEIDGEIEYFGLYENFLQNVEYFDSLDYKHSKNTRIELYFMSNNLCKNCYQLFTEEYRFRIKNPQDIDFIFSNSTFNFIDRHLEFERGRELLLDFILNNEFLKNMCTRVDYGTRKQLEKKQDEKFNNEFISLITKLKDDNNLDLDFGVFDIEIPEFELTDDEKELYKHFDILKDLEEKEYYTIPLEYQVDHSLEENEYIKYLDEKYKKGRFIYIINEETRVSRVKVLRVLSLFKSKGIEITAETVKFAMKFDLIAYENDIYNINNSLNDFQNERTKKLC